MKRTKQLYVGVVVLVFVALVAGCTATTAPAPAPVEAPTAAAVEEATAEPAEEATAEPAEEATAEPAEEATAEPAEEAAVDFVAPEGALVAVPVDTVPVLDGVADDAVWADATEILIPVEDGANMGESEVALKAVYDAENIYFLLTYADPTESFIRSPWEKQADGTWSKLSDPDDKGGDNNLYYEDKMAFIWDIGNSIPDFADEGCATACHEGQSRDEKPYGNKYTSEGMGDIWHWKSVRNDGQIDDQYLDSTKYSAETPEAGRKSDPKDSGGYANNETEDKKLPAWMGPEGYPRDGAPGYILEADKLPFDDALFAAGDRIPGIVKSPMTGDRGNISAAWKWTDGVWTIEFSRALTTGSEFDVQFDDLAQPYHFGVSVFDNAQVRHAYQLDSSMLVFQP